MVRIHRIREAEDVDPHGVWRALGAPVITPCERGFLHCRLSECAYWFKQEGDKAWEINPPLNVLGPLLTGPWPVLRPLTGLL